MQYLSGWSNWNNELLISFSIDEWTESLICDTFCQIKNQISFDWSAPILYTIDDYSNGFALDLVTASETSFTHAVISFTLKIARFEILAQIKDTSHRNGNNSNNNRNAN